MKTLTRRIADIIIEDRIREDKGDIDGLASLIKESKVMQPVVIDTTNRLIDGERRILAAKKLGWSKVPVFVATEPKDAVDHLIAERNLNNSKPFTTSELVAIGRRIEEVERAKAGERRNSKLKHGDEIPVRPNSDERGAIEESGRSDEKAADSIGMGRDTYRKAKEIADAAETDPTRNGDLPAKMDAESVNAAHKELKQREQQTADPKADACAAFCAKANAMTHKLDALVRECETMKADPLGYSTHWASIQSNLQAARKGIHNGRAKFACPYCEGKGAKGKGDCSSCKGTGRVSRANYLTGCKAVGVPAEESDD